MKVTGGFIVIILIVLGAVFFNQYKKGNIDIDIAKTLTSGSDSSVFETDSDFVTDNEHETRNERLLRYVNNKNSIDSDYEPALVDYMGFKVSSDMVSDLDSMIKAAKESGVNLEIECVYVTQAQQQKKYELLIEEYSHKYDISLVKAQSEVMKITPDGDHSEHRLGLNVTFFDSNTDNFEKTKAYIK